MEPWNVAPPRANTPPSGDDIQTPVIFEASWLAGTPSNVTVDVAVVPSSAVTVATTVLLPRFGAATTACQVPTWLIDAVTAAAPLSETSTELMPATPPPVNALWSVDGSSTTVQVPFVRSAMVRSACPAAHPLVTPMANVLTIVPESVAFASGLPGPVARGARPSDMKKTT